MANLIEYTEEELLIDLRKSNENAYLTIFNRYWLKLYNIAYTKLRSHDEAEEVVQSLFIKLWDSRETLLINNLEAYLISSLYNRIINYIKPKISQVDYWNYCKKYLKDYQSTTEDMVIFNELSEEIERAMKQLPEKSQQVFRLNRLEGRSVSEIAVFLKLSERAIEYHLTKSIRTIKLYLKDYIVSISSVCLFIF